MKEHESYKRIGTEPKRLSIVLRREVTKIRSFEAEHAQARKTTIFSEVSMTVNHRNAPI